MVGILAPRESATCQDIARTPRPQSANHHPIAQGTQLEDRMVKRKGRPQPRFRPQFLFVKSAGTTAGALC